MSGMEPKRVLILRVLQILRKYSDSEHLLKQNDIAAILERDYGLTVERKAIGRAIASLQDCGYDIETSHSGAFLSGREFADSELRLLIDGVLSSRYIPERYSRDLINKLCGLTSIYFRSHVNHVRSIGDWDKTDNRSLFLNIELIDQAIEEQRQVTFHYNRYGADKKLFRSAFHRVSPYQLVIRNQRYYLISYEEHWKNMGFYRLDHITDMQIIDRPLTGIRSVPGYENGIDYREFTATRPYMYTDKPVPVEFLIDSSMMDAVIDWFGTNFRVRKTEEGKLKISLKVSPSAMEFWALQYLNHVEVLSPSGLRERIADDIRIGVKKYLKE